MTNHMRYAFEKMNSVTALSIGTSGQMLLDTMKASGASERFLRAAASLPAAGYLGWQIAFGGGDPAADHSGAGVVFAGPGVKLTGEDLSWIFRDVVTADGNPEAILEDLWESGRSVYRILPEPVSIGQERQSSYVVYQQGETEMRPKLVHFEEMSAMLVKAGAVIRIVAGADPEDPSGCGMVFLSLPEEMPLRLRCVLSMAFHHTTIEEIARPQGTGEERDAGQVKASSAEQGMEKACLPGSCLNKIMEGLLVSSMKNVNRGDDECSEDVLIGDEVNFDSFTPLEELELSVRAYNCLKRAGIDSIEVLMLLTDEELSQVRNLGSRSIEEIRGKLIERDAARSGGANPDTASKPVDYAAALEELIGLDNVKKQVRKIAAFARMKQDMQAQGRSDLPAVLNMEFAGNPGTAKTTVARILAGIFHEIGLLSSAEIVEVGRADLVGKYVGHTADRVREVFQRAKGRLLFVDEAYSLLEGQERSFGDEAINTIVQEMENHRAETIVIFAGYPDQMKDFMDRNPGLRSRVPFRICFEDYSAEEMLQITELEASRRGFPIDPAAKERVLELCGAAVGRADAGNGRFCRNLVENAILEYAARVYGDEGASEQKDCVLRAGDFSPSELSATEGTQGKAPRVIGFRV